ncbi:MAG TPA: heavy-metal-associated domain-containing protein, partial [Flavitalea sp.]|nr:heavy-metal-associated domain-containing protein [Flavitalea sp.]
MKRIQLQTNIMCGSCVAKVTPTLNRELGEQNWSIDTTNLKKLLTVMSENHTEKDVIKAVEMAGYRAERMLLPADETFV